MRPHGSQSAIEKETGRVRPNYLSGLYGGITTRQARTIARLPGVETAAPIAMLGQILQTVAYPLDVTDLMSDATGPALLRYRTTEHSSRGLATVAGPAGYVYLTDRPMHLDFGSDDLATVERVGGRKVPVCRDISYGDVSSPFDPLSSWTAQCWSRLGGMSGERWPVEDERIVAYLRFTFPVLLAAVDPDAEAALTGVDDAVVRGRYLKHDDAATPSDPDGVEVPVLASSTSLVDQVSTVRIDRLGSATIAGLRAPRGGLSFAQARRLVLKAPGEPVATEQLDADELHQEWLYGSGDIYPRLMFTTSAVSYRPDGPDLAAVPRTSDVSVWRSSLYSNEAFAIVPPAASDTGYRTVTPVPPGETARFLQLSTIGEFDPRKVSTGSALSEVPLETYQVPRAEPADAATRELLSGKPLLPDTNPAGYLQSPPLLLTSMAALPAFTSENSVDYPSDSPIPKAPVSVVRVRVEGVTGADDESRERIRLAAEQIRESTGLDVDVMTGSSPHPTTVHLPATRHGAPALSLTENWVDKGVATVLLEAIDRKSVALFLLILLTSAVSVGISATAAVRARRTQLGVLSCLGWRPGTIVRSVLADLLAVGAVAGMVGALVSVPVGVLLDVDLAWWRALVAVPGAVLVVLVAGIVPALAASRAVPADAVRPAVSTPRRPTRLRGTASMALGYLRRTPGRVVAATLTLALAVASLTMLIGIVAGFHDTVVGSLLGNAVSVQVRGVDIAAGVLVGVLALGSLADILYLDIREQASSYASLQAAGWRDLTLGALIVQQAVLIGLLGALVGAAAGLSVLSRLTPLNTTVWWSTALIAVLAVVLAGGVALLPAASLRRLPTAVLLSEE